jgi:glycosyltransferase involved in cell wall biosynthesis
VGGIPDVVTDMKNGLLVPVGDRNAITGAMERLIDDADLRRSLGVEARARAEALSIENYAQDLMELYRRPTGTDIPPAGAA